MISYQKCFEWAGSCVSHIGRRVEDKEAFADYLRHRVRQRVFDTSQLAAIQADLKALATTEMATETLRAVLSSEPDPEPWEVGEAFAECVLTDEHGIVWPWNEARDLKTPRASLPGADLVGFISVGPTTLLLLGEVKTSTDTSSPPGVMTGRAGMIHQLDELAHRLDIHGALLRWLHARCHGRETWPMFQAAVKNYLQSRGRHIVLAGLLLRDTPENVKDIQARAESLDKKVASPTKVALDVWYAPLPIVEWVPAVKADV